MRPARLPNSIHYTQPKSGTCKGGEFLRPRVDFGETRQMTTTKIDRASLEPPNPNFRQAILDSFGQQGLMRTLGAEISKLAPGSCEITAPFKQDLSQQNGFFHAGVSGAIADTACGYAAMSLAPSGANVLTAEYKINLLRPAAGSVLRARATVIKPGKSLTVCQADVVVDGKEGEEKLCALVIATIAVIPSKKSANL